jgi:uncharacterized repeat protein (TIGR02543 family)
MTTQNICLQAASEMRPEGITPPILHNTLNVSKLHVLTYRWTLVVLLMLLTTASAWAWTGSGTSSDPYQITSKSDLETLRDNVNGGQNYNNVYFKQTANITLSGNWTPIGTTESTPFKGHYDGGNFAITGLQVTGSYQYAGLFGVIASGDYVPQQGYYRQAELKNINIVECNINVGDVFNGKAGGIAGQASTIDMSGCRVSGTITGNKEVCGLIGHMAASAGIKVTDCFVDVSVTGTSENSPIVFLMLTITTTASGNYCHDRIGNVAAGITATPLYMVTGAPSGVTVAETNATVTYNDKHYFAAGATATLTVDANQAFKTFSVSGATDYNVAADKKSATVTLASSDATVSATLQTIGGSCGTSATWALTQDNGGNYTRLTISGSGAMENYGHINDAIWHTTAPWGYNLTSVTIGNDITTIGNYAFIGCQQLSSLTIGSGVTTIGTNAIDHCDGLTEVTLPASVSSIGAGGFKNCVGLTRVNIERTDDLISIGTDCFYGCPNGLVIVAPTPALALQYKDAANWSAFADKFRLALRSYLFTATNEGGVAAYAITCEDDLRNLADVINGNSGTSSDITGSGMTFRQTADITLSDQTFDPIGAQGTYGKNFKGTYDGGNHTISGLKVSTDDQYAGLFGKVVGGTIKNVVLISPTVTSNYSHNSIFAQVGALVGRMDGYSSVENCLVISPTVSASNGNKYVGAIVGTLYTSSDKLINSLFYSTTDYAYAGSYEAGSIVNSGRGRKVIIGEGVTIENPEATSLEYGFQYDIDGNGVAETYYREGVMLTLPNNAPTGYLPVFSANGIAFSGNTYTVNSTDGDVTLAATGSTAPINYAVHFEGNGSTGGEMADQPFTYGTAQNLNANAFTRTGYTFTGWATSTDGDVVYTDKESVFNLTTTNGETVTLYAIWTTNTYTITYDLNGGSLAKPNPATYNIETATITLNNPTREGYTFTGWTGTGLDAATMSVTIAKGSTGNKTFYAIWSINTYTITYNLNGGTLLTDKNSYTIESSDITLDEPSRTGYTFLGWYDNKDLTGDAVTTIANGSTGDVELWAKWGIPYIDADGNTLYRNSATVLTSGTYVDGLSAGWYVVTEDVSYNSQFRCTSGDIHLILCDGAKMTVTNSSNAILVDNGSLTIYAQSSGSSMGQLVATSSNSDGIQASLGSVNICGGRITATGYNRGIYGRYYVTIHGGQVSATGDNGIHSGTITLGLRNATDYITASSYRAGYDAIYVKDGQTLTDEDGNTYSGKLTYEQSLAIGGKTLYRYIENLDLAATAYDGNYWTTFYCGHTGYKIDDSENACAYTAEYDKDNSRLTLHKLGTVIPKGTAVIIVGADNSISMTASDETATVPTNNLHGVDTRTATADIKSALGDGTFYVLSQKSDNFGFFEYTGEYMPARKAYLLVPGGTIQARELTMVFDEETGIRPTPGPSLNGGEWYDLSGRKLNGKPTKKGIYINNGKKVVIK